MIIIEISKNISISLQHLVCDCTIMLEMKVGSVLSSHFKNLSASFLGLLLVLCNILCVNCISSIFINIGRPRNYTTHTLKIIENCIEILIFTPISYRYKIEIKILISHTTS